MLKTVFLLCGCVIGAGFVGGTELAEFFGETGYLSFLVFSAILFFAGFSVVLLREKKSEFLIVSEREKFFTDKAFFATEFVFCSAMLAGINEILKSAGAGIFSYVISFAVLSISCYLSEKDKLHADKVSSVLMPFIVFLFNALIIIRLFRGKPFEATREVRGSSSLFGGITKVCLYVFLNVFVAAPAVKNAAKENRVSSLIIASAISSVIIAAEAFLILRLSEVCGTFRDPLPTLSAMKNGGAFSAFCVYAALIVAAYTSFYTCLCALKSEGNKKTRDSKEKIVTYLFVYCFSLAGLKRIVVFVYPVFGAFGVCYVINSIKMLLCKRRKIDNIEKTPTVRGIKNEAKAHNNRKFRFGGVLKCLKREKIR